MGYIKEPGNVDLIVGPSAFTEATRQIVVKAIKLYKETGRKSVSFKTDISNDTITTSCVNSVRKAGADEQL